ncbi:T9SS-dependent choice-of-anchor J family protein [Flavobacterium caeni]|uniref:Por secretion system C-terminal sorting domain-containing protein n=1 Tax=Flavobacterium caeni TaxID=490189 RepID=A0A1G5DA22_9FLAO|nr:T9SS type A sorting domain-containing protein [Flavobacterium caeni]SCY11525.1 Por secretion system C-terminal sorting domain-containing protein [Flavobacterium caeni]
MKTKLLFAALLGTVAASNAQTTLYSQEFTTATGSGLTIMDGDGDANNWGLFTGNATTAAWGLVGNFAGSRSWNPATGTPPGPLTPNNFLLTPEVVIPESFGATTLSFRLGATNPDFPAEQISIYLAPAAANSPALIQLLTPVFNYTLTADDAQAAEIFMVDVSDYAGQTVKIVMRHHDCTDQELLYLDDLTLVQETLATKSFNAAQFSVFPNPASDVVNVVNSNKDNITSVVLTDVNGRTVKTFNFDSMTKVQVNIADLTAGVYLMNIKTANGEITKKIVKN